MEGFAPEPAHVYSITTERASNNSSFTPVAVREYRLKLTPASATVAPRGKLRPTSLVLVLG